LKKVHELYRECVRSEEYESGIQALSKMIAEGIETGTALSLRSHLYQLAGNHSQATQDLDRAIALKPESGALYHNRGSLRHTAKNYRLALADFCEAVLLAHAVGDDDLIDAAEHHFGAILEALRTP